MSVQTRPPSRGPSRPSSDRLPRAASPVNRNREIRLGLLGVSGLAALLIGIPVALVLFVGYPLPRSGPSSDWLTTSMSATLLIKVLACIVWLVWAHFVVCLVSEWQAVRRGRLPSGVPFGGGSQVIARRLIAAALLLTGVATAFPHSGSSHSAARPTVAIAHVASPTAGAVPAEAAKPATQTGTKYYVVQPPHGRRYDSLWDISERTMKDPLRYKEIFALNKDRIQTDGRKLIDANLILPGWELRLPADASGPGVHVMPATPPATTAPTAPGGQAVPGSPGAVGAVGNAGHAAHVAPATANAEHRSPDSMLLGGALMLAGLLVALRARRGPYGAADEGELRGADSALATQLDRALRELAFARAAQGRELPQPAIAWASTEQVTLNLAGGDITEPPVPWSTCDEGRSWTRSLAVDSFNAVDLQNVAAPYPGLLSVGRESDYELFVDFEQAPGLVSIAGDPDRGRELAAALAVQAATSLWSDGIRVTVVGFGDGAEFAQIEPRAVEQVARIADVLARIEDDQAAVLALQKQLAIDGVLSGRQLRRSEAWEPRLIVLSGPPTPEEANRLQALTGSQRSNFVVLVVGETPAARWRFAIDGAGRLDLGVLGASADAHRLTPAAVAELAAILSAADHRRAPAARSVAGLTPIGAVTNLAPLAPAARQRERAVATVSLLGPIEIQASGPLEPAKRALATEIAVAVALHADGAHDAVLRASIWPRGVSDEIFQAAMADVGTWLGTDPGGSACLVNNGGRWYVSTAVRVDWDELRELAATPSGPEEPAALARAISLFRGEAFSAVPSGRYGWLAFARAARDSRVVATTIVRRSASLLIEQKRVSEAQEVLRRGLVLVPTSELLWRDLLTLSSWDGPGPAAGVADEMYEVLRVHRAWAEPETDALVAQLVPERRPSIA